MVAKYTELWRRIVLSRKPSVTYRVPKTLSPVSRVGYSCQVLLAEAIRQRYDPAKRNHYYAWFATELNPATVDLTSRPLHVYEDLDVAVKLRSTGHPKIKDLRLKLQYAVEGNVSDAREKGKLKQMVALADISWFRPVLVKIDLTGVDLGQCRADAIMRGATPGEGRDEYMSANLDANMYWVIVE